MLNRLRLEYHKPETIGRKLDPERQQAFIETYENVLNSLGRDEAVLLADAVHPTHAARPVGCLAPAKEHLESEQTSGRQRLNIHGAIDLETGKTAMIDVETVDAVSTIRLLQAIEAMYPLLALIHVFLDNARYHHAALVREWLGPAQPGRPTKLHSIPAYCPHLNPIERLWVVMHKSLTHNRTYPTYREFADAMITSFAPKPPVDGEKSPTRSQTISYIPPPASFRIWRERSILLRKIDIPVTTRSSNAYDQACVSAFGDQACVSAFGMIDQS